MADDYEYDDGLMDMLDDGWLYVEDEFALADELAEGQVPDPGYPGTAYEIEMEGYDFDLFSYWDDLEYADDAYWDYGLPTKEGEPGNKRKREGRAQHITDKRRRVAENTDDRDAEPMVFRSRDERNRLFFRNAPPLKERSKFAFMSDWKERFADADGVVVNYKMPAAMKKAAEAQDDDTPPKARQLDQEAYMDEEDAEEGWEDEEGDGEEGGLALDPEMLKTILREKLGAAGLDGMDEDGFMQTIQKIVSGEGDGDDAAGALADSLLGKVTSEGGNDALSGWLSGQGVSIEQEDDASSVATAELPEGTRKTGRGRTGVHNSSPDSAVSVGDSYRGGKTTKMPLHSGSPSASSKKRGAGDDEPKPSKKQKKVQFDVPPSSSPGGVEQDAAQDVPTSEDPLMSEATVKDKTAAKTKAANAAASAANRAASQDGTTKSGRKRKASSTEDTKIDRPTAKKARSRELQDLGPLPEAPSPAPPAKRTRSARVKQGH